MKTIKKSIYILMMGCVICTSSCSKEMNWIKRDLPDLLWYECVSEHIFTEYDKLRTGCYDQVEDKLETLRRNYEATQNNIDALNAIGFGQLMALGGITHAALEKEYQGKRQAIIDPIDERCDAIMERMDQLRYLRDSSLVEQQLDYETLSASILNSGECIDSVARCLMINVLCSTPKPEIQKIRKKNDVWIVDFNAYNTQYVTFSETFNGDMIPQYSPYITDDGKLIPVDRIHMY